MILIFYSLVEILQRCFLIACNSTSLLASYNSLLLLTAVLGSLFHWVTGAFLLTIGAFSLTIGAVWFTVSYSKKTLS